MKKQIKQLSIIVTLWASVQLAGAQTFIPLYSFGTVPDGSLPRASLMQASDGYLYGTAPDGGSSFNGMIFRITTNGMYAPFYSFTGAHDGVNPGCDLVQASDGYLYGTAVNGGTNNLGTVFRISTNGIMTPLYSFIGTNDGSHPIAGLVQASDGYLYGTTQNGSTNNDGTIFRISTNGVLTPLHTFMGNDGSIPLASLVQASDGNLYGTTELGGTNNFGTVFRITTNGAFTSLCSFTDGNDGAFPWAGLLKASDGNLYGTAIGGGNNGKGSGTVFRFTTNGILTTLYSFTYGNDGGEPLGGLVQANDGYLYGTTTAAGGIHNDGTIFRITTNGVFTALYSFTGGHDGANPYTGLVQANNLNFYGTARVGGTNDYGTIFELTLPPPILNISPDGNQSIVLWPAWATNYVLQTATNLASPNWVTLSNSLPPTVIVTNSLPAQFFRLANP